MIGVIGHMSGGKSYFAVEDMLAKILDGHVVCSNIRLNCQAVTSALGVCCVIWKRYYFYLDDSASPSGYNVISISKYEDWPAGAPRGSLDYDMKMVFVYLDEASSIFDSLSHSAEGHIQKIATWARHTRKMGIELVLLMQFASELHKRLRIHIQEYVSCRNTNDIVIPLFGCHLPFFLRNFSIRTRLMPDLETQIGKSTWVKLNPLIYRCYNTAQIVVGSNANRYINNGAIDLTTRFVSISFRQFLVLVVLSLATSLGVLWLILII